MAKSGTSFKPGQSGNPGGRPKVMAEVQELAREHTPAAINTLVSIMNDEKAHHSARVAASTAILDRGYGKAPASVKIENKEPSVAETFINILKSIDDDDEKIAARKAEEAKKNEPADPSPSGNPDSVGTEQAGTVH